MITHRFPKVALLRQIQTRFCFQFAESNHMLDIRIQDMSSFVLKLNKEIKFDDRAVLKEKVDVISRILPSISILDNTSVSRLIRCVSLLASGNTQIEDLLPPLINESTRELRRVSFSMMDISEIIHSIHTILRTDKTKLISNLTHISNLLVVLFDEILEREYSIRLVSEFGFKKSQQLQNTPLSAISNICYSLEGILHLIPTDERLTVAFGQIRSLTCRLISINTSREAIFGTRAFHLVSLLNSLSHETSNTGKKGLMILMNEIEAKACTLSSEHMRIVSAAGVVICNNFREDASFIKMFEMKLSGILAINEEY